MSRLGWVAFVAFLVCMALGAAGVRSWLLAAFAFAAFLIVCAAAARPRARRRASHHLIEHIGPDHPDGFGNLDRRARGL